MDPRGAHLDSTDAYKAQMGSVEEHTDSTEDCSGPTRCVHV
jgi:hypothetical protein